MSKQSESVATMDGPVSCVVVGAGSRGTGYAEFACEQPQRLRVVAVAEPRKFRRERLRDQHSISPENTFDDWRDLVKRDKLADFAIVSTQDQDHKEPAVALAALGYHILLEKPMAVTREDCLAIAAACEDAGVMLCVCHVLRYTPASRKLKEIIDSGLIGKVQHLQHTENVGYYHFAHSFVRGNWRNEEESTFSLLAKSCHDIDLIRYWMGGECRSVSSFGSLTHFKPSEAPDGATDRCLECPHADTCPYSAKRLYLERAKRGHDGWPLHALVDAVPDVENITSALRTGPYGRCAYKCDNDVVDNQVVNFEFDGGRVASFSMVACTEKLCIRDTIITGSHGQLKCFDGSTITHHDFRSGVENTIKCRTPPQATRLRGHGGADWFLMDSFVRAVATGDATEIPTAAGDALSSHLLMFSAEQARKEQRVVKM